MGYATLSVLLFVAGVGRTARSDRANGGCATGAGGVASAPGTGASVATGGGAGTGGAGGGFGTGAASGGATGGAVDAATPDSSEPSKFQVWTPRDGRTSSFRQRITGGAPTTGWPSGPGSPRLTVASSREPSSVRARPTTDTTYGSARSTSSRRPSNTPPTSPQTISSASTHFRSMPTGFTFSVVATAKRWPRR